jgi:hypothetical protein
MRLKHTQALVDETKSDGEQHFGGTPETGMKKLTSEWTGWSQIR